MPVLHHHDLFAFRERTVPNDRVLASARPPGAHFTQPFFRCQSALHVVVPLDVPNTVQHRNVARYIQCERPLAFCHVLYHIAAVLKAFVLLPPSAGHIALLEVWELPVNVPVNGSLQPDRRKHRRPELLMVERLPAFLLRNLFREHRMSVRTTHHVHVDLRTVLGCDGESFNGIVQYGKVFCQQRVVLFDRFVGCADDMCRLSQRWPVVLQSHSRI